MFQRPEPYFIFVRGHKLDLSEKKIIIVLFHTQYFYLTELHDIFFDKSLQGDVSCADRFHKNFLKNLVEPFVPNPSLPR